MNQGCNAAVFEHEWAAFALPAGLDHPPPRCLDLESRRLDAFAPVLALDAVDFALIAETENACTPATPSSCYSSTSSSTSSNTSSIKATPRSKTRHRSGSIGAASTKPHRHHSKKASRKQVHELQAMVNTMQVQVDGAAAEIQQLTQLVGQFALQRKQEHERFRRQEQEQRRQLFEEHEMDMDLDVQQRHLCAQVKHDRELFERRLQEEEQQQQCYGSQSPRQEVYPLL